ncbi:group 1 glycosyl transferase [Neobacillus bataviensis LMG 21833]|uniref:Group 1 glycosyl transferase n=1 Tax=Neobacillus bataviensis LMG 21833 TaxID=1117379 RepID=K6CE37_9BACI|nr:glycosyltransferase family 4 protein [Neobacillus bataviensis]EKN69405.1 group 1 glycosyl transferase [Neobacillus bataviensis LMG 21833]
MYKRVLFCATVDYHFKAFHLPYLKWFKEQGWEVHVAASGTMNLPYVDKKYNIPIQRSPFNKMNLGAYKELKDIIDQNQFKIIHCHTPMGGLLTRLAARKARGKGTKVLYTAHGFHFCKGAPLTNWMLYYPIERVLSQFTDCLITINEEDYRLACKHQFKANQIEHIHGVGVNTERFAPEKDKSILRQKYHYSNDAFLMFYAAEFNKNKNQELLIRSIAIVKNEIPNAKLLLAGEGPLLQECKGLADKLGVKNMIDFLGYRNDITQLLKISDIAVASSLREGLPVNIMEAMACGLPIIAVENRGHRDLISDNENGWLVGNNNMEISDKMKILAVNKELRDQFGLKSRGIVLSKYSLNKILEEKSKLYQEVIDKIGEIHQAFY